MTSFTKSDLEERDLMFSSAHLTVSLFGAVEVVALFFRCDRDSTGMEFWRDGRRRETAESPPSLHSHGLFLVNLARNESCSIRSVMDAISPNKTMCLKGLGHLHITSTVAAWPCIPMP